MKNLHPLAPIGAAINVIVGLVAMSQLNDGYYWDTVDTVFTLFFVGGIALNVIGVIMMLAGRRAGGIVGAIGGAVFVPIGIIGMIGFMMSRTRMQTAVFEKSDLERAAEIVAERQRAQAAQASRTDEQSKQTEQPEQAAVSAQAGADAAGGGASGTGSAAKTMGEPLEAVRAVPLAEVTDTQKAGEQPVRSGHTFAEITAPARAGAPGVPKAYFPFSDQRVLFVVLLVACVVAFFALSNAYRTATTMIFPGIMCIVFIVMHSRVAKWPVFALYENHLEFVPNLYGSLLSIQYSAIIRATVTRGAARLMVRRPDGLEEVVKVGFGFIPGGQRDQARAVMRAKMTELGVLVEE